MSEPYENGGGSEGPGEPDDMAAFEREFADRAARIRAGGEGSHDPNDPNEPDRWVEPASADTPMWLSHHWPSEYDRCVVVGSKHVCRRCLVLYPLAAAFAVLAASGVGWPDRLDVWLCWLLPLPAVVEFVGEHAGLVRYQFRRSVLLTILLAVAGGKLYIRYIHDVRDVLAWSVVITYGGVCLLAALARAFRPPLDRR